MIPWSLRVGGRSRSQVEDIISVVALLTEFIRIEGINNYGTGIVAFSVCTAHCAQQEND